MAPMSTQTGVIPTLSRGQRLDIAMRYANLKPEDMAARMHCGATTIRNYISGRTQIDYPAMRLWADITGVDLDWIVYGHETEPGTAPDHALQQGWFTESSWEAA